MTTLSDEDWKVIDLYLTEDEIQDHYDDESYLLHLAWKRKNEISDLYNYEK